MATTNTQGNKFIKGKGVILHLSFGLQVIGSVVLGLVAEQHTMLRTCDRGKHTHPITSQGIRKKRGWVTLGEDM